MWFLCSKSSVVWNRTVSPRLVFYLHGKIDLSVLHFNLLTIFHIDLCFLFWSRCYLRSGDIDSGLRTFEDYMNSGKPPMVELYTVSYDLWCEKSILISHNEIYYCIRILCHFCVLEEFEDWSRSNIGDDSLSEITYNFVAGKGLFVVFLSAGGSSLIHKYFPSKFSSLLSLSFFFFFSPQFICSLKGGMHYDSG